MNIDAKITNEISKLNLTSRFKRIIHSKVGFKLKL